MKELQSLGLDVELVEEQIAEAEASLDLGGEESIEKVTPDALIA